MRLCVCLFGVWCFLLTVDIMNLLLLILYLYDVLMVIKQYILSVVGCKKFRSSWTKRNLFTFCAGKFRFSVGIYFLVLRDGFS